MKTSLEDGFRRWGRFVCRHRWPVLVASLAVSAVLVYFAPGLRVDNSSKSMLRPGDPARQQYDAFLDEFGQDHLVVILVRAPSLFTADFLTKLHALHQELAESVPYVNEVTSLQNARLTRGEGDELIVEDLLEEWPDSPEDLALFEQRVRESPYYRDLLVDDAFQVTAVLVEPLVYSQQGVDDDALEGFEEDAGADDEPAALLTPGETSELVAAVMDIVERHQADDFEIHVAGSTASNNRTAALVMNDVRVFMSWTAVMIAAVLLLLFRRVSGVVIPLLVVFIALFATFGVMALLDIPTSIAGQVLAPLLICVGVCDAVHLLTVIYERLDRGDDRAAAVSHALGHSGLAVMMTSVTTAGGLLSFVSGELAQIVNLGIAAPLGILIAFLLTVTLLPSLVAIVPLRADPSRGATRLDAWIAARTAALGDWSLRRSGVVIAGTLLLVGVAAVGATRLRFSQDTVRWLPEEEPLRVATELIDSTIRGSTSLEVLVDTKRDNGLHEPAVLRAIDAAMRTAEHYDDGAVQTGKVFSIVDILKETHRALNENRAEYYRIPDDRELVAQEFLLFENSGSDDLADFVDTRYRVARVMVRTPSADYMHYPKFIEDVREAFLHELPGPVEITTTGSAALYARTFSVVNTSMARSYVIAFLVIAPLMVLLIGNLRLGLLAMIPNLVPVLLTLGLMGWLGIRIDNSTLMVGCIVFGLAVDDTIHFMHGFQRTFRSSGDVAGSVHATLATTGVALVMTTVVISIGFFVLTFAYMTNTREFGILACFATITALFADVVLMPAILAKARVGPLPRAG